jgi:hypothetical protein
MRIRGILARSRMTVTTILLDGKRLTRNIRTLPGQYMSPAGVESQLENEVRRVDEFFPGREFRLVPLRDGNFNFVETKSDA